MTPMDLLWGDDSALLRAVLRILPDDGSRLLLVIDQFEELFTLVADEQRDRFLRSLIALATDPRKPQPGAGDAACGLLRPTADAPGVRPADDRPRRQRRAAGRRRARSGRARTGVCASGSRSSGVCWRH